MILRERIEWVNKVPPKGWGWETENKSYLFLVKMKCKIIPKGLKGAGKPVPGGYMFYGGKRKLQSKKETIGQYIGSIESEAYNELYATSEEVTVIILDYDNFENIGYGESKLLRDAENMAGAATSLNWFNSTNGGGTGTQGYTKVPDMKLVKEKVDRTIKIVEEGRIKNPDIGTVTIEEQLVKINKLLEESGEDVYRVGFSDKKELKKLLSPDNILQIRDEMLIDWLVINLKEAFNLDPNPSKYGFSVQLEYENSQDKKVISGNNRGSGCHSSRNGIGMFSVLIPYSDWGNWPWHLLKRFGGKFNPQIQNERSPNSIETAASDCLTWARGEGFVDDNGNVNYKHKSNKDSLVDDGWTPNKIEKIWDACQRKLEGEELDQDDNIVVMSDENIKNDIIPGLKKGYDKKILEMTISEDNPNGEFDLVHKISANLSVDGKVLEKLMAWNWPTKDTGKKIAFLIYFPNKDKKKRWENGSVNHKKNSKSCEKKLRKNLEIIFDKFDIEIIKVPLTKKTLIRDKWIIKEKTGE